MVSRATNRPEIHNIVARAGQARESPITIREAAPDRSGPRGAILVPAAEHLQLIGIA